MKDSVLAELKEKMIKSLGALSHDLSGLSTGRASASLLDPVVVEAYGNRMPLAQMATISAPEARLLSVQVWDASLVKTVEKAIANANLGLNCSADGQVIRIPMPDLSEERRKEMAKLASKYGENAKVAIRNIRRDGMDSAKKMEKSNEISEDEMHDLNGEIQKATDNFVKQIDDKTSNKEKDILQV